MINEEEMKSIILPQYLVKTGLDGLAHILHVAHFGKLIAQKECPYFLDEVLLGCYLHDIGRGRFGVGSHGDVGAEFAREILAMYFPNTSVDWIVYSIKHHDKGKTTKDRTIGSVWDADRISLWRLGKVPDLKRISTNTGKLLIPYAKKYINEHRMEYN